MYRMMILEASVFPDPLSPAIKKTESRPGLWVNECTGAHMGGQDKSVCGGGGGGGGAVQF